MLDNCLSSLHLPPVTSGGPHKARVCTLYTVSMGGPSHWKVHFRCGCGMTDQAYFIRTRISHRKVTMSPCHHVSEYWEAVTGVT